MPDSPRLALPLLVAGQSQKDVTHNDAVLAIERKLALAVQSRSQSAPPATPIGGDCQIVPASGAAAWGRPAGTLMHWQGNGWLAEAPHDGQIATVIDEGIMLVHRGGWQALWPVAGLSIGGRQVLAAAPANIPAPTGGSVVDLEARAVLASLLANLRAQGLLA